MDRDTALQIHAPNIERYVRIIRDEHEAFTANIQAGYRAKLQSRARACCVFDTIKAAMLINFGEEGAVRLSHADTLDFLFVEANPVCVCLRCKKLRRYSLKSSNHDSDRQDALRESEETTLFGVQLSHQFIGYTENEEDPLNPLLERIALTCESPDGLRWSKVLWVADSATDAVKIETGYEQTTMDEQFKVKPRKSAEPKKAEGVRDDEGEGKQKKKAE
jgi:hypothetical protein